LIAILEDRQAEEVRWLTRSLESKFLLCLSAAEQIPTVPRYLAADTFDRPNRDGADAIR